MQIDPIKLSVKAPGSERLKLKYEKLVSSCGFKFNLRRYNMGAARGDMMRQLAARVVGEEPGVGWGKPWAPGGGEHAVGLGMPRWSAGGAEAQYPGGAASGRPLVLKSDLIVHRTLGMGRFGRVR